MKAALTDKMVADLKAPDSGQLELWDTVVTDLYLRVSQGGTKTWMRRFYRDGVREREQLGRFPEMRVAIARNRVRLQTANVTPESAASVTFGEVCELFLAKANLADSTRKEWTRLVAREMRDLSVLDPNDAKAFRTRVRAVLDAVARRSVYTRNRVHEASRRIYNWGVGQDMIEPAPAFAGIEKLVEKPRERVLTDDEVRKILAAAAVDYVEWRAYWKLLFYTGARRGSVLKAEWEHVDLKEKVWMIPSENLKGRAGKRRSAVVPLVDSVVRALELQREVTGHTAFVVSNRKTDAAVSNPQKAADRVRDLSGVVGWHVHDVRHTVATGLGRLRVSQETIDRVLHHVSGSRISRVYNQWEYVEEKTAALTKWAAHLDSLKQ